ncbi:MAG: ABC transporter ATP-binding protein [Candidatus Hydrogenedentes bacterium]|nr:ABC transporter ATP-binding protein [Candidatus Hydrogenedentota bacterium]
MSNSHLVELNDVDKVFHTRHFFFKDEDTARRRLYAKRVVHAVDRVTFGIRHGEIFGLLGPNGAGKTTTVKMISGLVRPSSGDVFVDGLHVERKRLKVLRKVGVVLEGTRTCVWPLTPLENLAYFGNLKDVKGSILKQRARELLIFMGLKDKMNVQVRKLSRGEKQKLAICIALIADPPVILLDEPTTGLDVQTSRVIKDKIVQMTREQGKCVLVTTHDMHVAQELCDRIGIINMGQLVACKPTEELLSLFFDLTYEFHLDRLPDSDALADLPGVLEVEPARHEDGPVLVLRLQPELAQRSEALYTVTGRLREQGVLLRAIIQRQASLESVFLHLTTSPVDLPKVALTQPSGAEVR